MGYDSVCNSSNGGGKAVYVRTSPKNRVINFEIHDNMVQGIVCVTQYHLVSLPTPGVGSVYKC